MVLKMIPTVIIMLFVLMAVLVPVSLANKKEDEYSRAKEKEKSLAEIDKELLDFACAVSMNTVLDYIKNEKE